MMTFSQKTEGSVHFRQTIMCEVFYLSKLNTNQPKIILKLIETLHSPHLFTISRNMRIGNSLHNGNVSLPCICWMHIVTHNLHHVGVFKSANYYYLHKVSFAHINASPYISLFGIKTESMCWQQLPFQSNKHLFNIYKTTFKRSNIFLIA